MAGVERFVFYKQFWWSAAQAINIPEYLQNKEKVNRKLQVGCALVYIRALRPWLNQQIELSYWID